MKCVHPDYNGQVLQSVLHQFLPLKAMHFSYSDKKLLVLIYSSMGWWWWWVSMRMVRDGSAVKPRVEQVTSS